MLSQNWREERAVSLGLLCTLIWKFVGCFSEQKWLEEKTQALMAATEHVERLNTENEKISDLGWVWRQRETMIFISYFYILKSLTSVCVFHSVLQDTKAKIQKMKQYQERLMACLGDVLEKHVPHPQNEPSTNKKKKVQWPVYNHLCLYNLFTYTSHAVATPMQLTMFHFHFQNVTQEFDEDLISLNEILEVGFD